MRLILILTMALAVLSGNTDTNGVVQLADVARRAFATPCVIATMLVAISCIENVTQSADVLRFPLARLCLRGPAVAGLFISDVTRHGILQLMLEILQAGTGESHRNWYVATVHQFVEGRSEIKILLGPRGSNVVAGASVSRPYPCFQIRYD